MVVTLVFAGVRTDGDGVDALTGTDEELVDLLRLGQGVPVPRHDIKRHAADAEPDEQRGADMRDPPELHLARADIDQRIELTVDGDDLVALAELGVLDEEKALGQA